MTPRKGRTGPIVTLAMGEAPPVVRETIRTQLTSHALVLVTKELRDPLVGDELERYLDNVARNVVMALYSLELDDD